MVAEVYRSHESCCQQKVCRLAGKDQGDGTAENSGLRKRIAQIAGLLHEVRSLSRSLQIPAERGEYGHEFQDVRGYKGAVELLPETLHQQPEEELIEHKYGSGQQGDDDVARQHHGQHGYGLQSHKEQQGPECLHHGFCKDCAAHLRAGSQARGHQMGQQHGGEVAYQVDQQVIDPDTEKMAPSGDGLALVEVQLLPVHKPCIALDRQHHGENQGDKGGEGAQSQKQAGAGLELSCNLLRGIETAFLHGGAAGTQNEEGACHMLERKQQKGQGKRPHAAAEKLTLARNKAS